MAYDSPLAYNLPAGAANTADDHFSAQDTQLLVQIERRIDLNGGTVAVTADAYNNAIVRAKSGTNTLTHAGTAGESIEFTYWNRSGSDDTVLGVTVPDGAVAAAFIDGPDNIVEVSQTFSGVSGVSATGPISSTGGTTPNLSILTNAANGVPLLDALNRYPALDGSQITNVSTAAMTGATAGAAGTAGSVPIPAAGDQAKVLLGAATWSDIPPFQDTSVVVVDSLDNSKALMFELGAIATGQTRTITMDDADVELSLVKEINREFTFSANATLTVAAHRNALIICDTTGITLTLPTTGNLYATGINTSGGDVTVGGTTVGTMQLFTIVTVGAVGVVKAST